MKYQQTQITFPKPADYSSVQDFFKTFYELNKDLSFFSFRYVSSKLQWPVSYMKEVMSGARSLTIKRGIQFAKFAQYDPLETESLLLLSIRNVLIENGEKEISDRGLESRRAKRSVREDTSDYIYEPRTLVIFSLIVWAKGMISPEEIIERSAVYDLTLEEAQESFRLLEARDFIRKISPGHYEYKTDSPLILDEKEVEKGEESTFPGINIHRYASSGFVNFCDQPQKMSCYNTGIVAIEPEKFRETAMKLIALRNWLGTTYQDTELRTKEGTVPFQFDLNLIPLIDIKDYL